MGSESFPISYQQKHFDFWHQTEAHGDAQEIWRVTFRHGRGKRLLCLAQLVFQMVKSTKHILRAQDLWILFIWTWFIGCRIIFRTIINDSQLSKFNMEEISPKSSTYNDHVKSSCCFSCALKIGVSALIPAPVFKFRHVPFKHNVFVYRIAVAQIFPLRVRCKIKHEQNRTNKRTTGFCHQLLITGTMAVHLWLL